MLLGIGGKREWERGIVDGAMELLGKEIEEFR